MAFNDNELSIQSSRPTYLFLFERQGKQWGFTNGDFEIDFNGVTYIPVQIKMDEITQSGGTDGDAVGFEIATGNGLTAYLDNNSSVYEITVTVRKMHLLEEADTGLFTVPTDPLDVPVFWVGVYVSKSSPKPNTRRLTFDVISLASKSGTRLTWERGCPHMVYGLGCNLNKAAFAVPVASIAVVSATEVTSATFGLYPDGYFSGGLFEWEIEPGVIDVRTIESHTGTQITLFGWTKGMATPTNMKAYPGCPRTMDVCHSRFGNSNNYGGVKYLQGKSPFDGDPVF